MATRQEAKIGILRGMETTFPDGLVHHINETYGAKGITAEFVSIDSVRMDGDPEYAVLLDRISHEVPFYRSYLKWASLKGTYVVNNPFWWSADDKFIEITKDESPVVGKQLINMKIPMDWTKWDG